MRAVIVLFALTFAACTSGEIYKQCSGGKSIDNLDDLVSVSSCTKAPCRLKKKTSVGIQIKFTPEREAKQLTNTVYANIAGIPFPFIGVDSTNACTSLFEADGKTKASCPLQTGKPYIYKNKIDVLEIYPRVKVIVHWALTSENGDVACFEVPARITN